MANLRLLAPVRRLAELLRDCLVAVWSRRRLRLALIVAVVLAPLLTGGWLWLRHSSLVAVQKVQVTGVHGPEAHAIDAALTNAGRRMSTLDVNRAALRAAVAPYPIVRDVRVSTSFPHGLHIEVIEQPPVAALTLAGTRTAVAADGVVLGPAQLSASLPALNIGSSTKSVSGHSVRDPGLLGALGVLGAAPAPLAKLMERAYMGPKGLTVAMQGGLLAYFGDGSRPHAKWLALSSVLADPSSAGASYVDVRLPERPAAGFVAGAAPPVAGESTEQEGTQSSEDLTAGLSAAAGNDSSSTATESEEAEPASPESSSGEAAGGGGEESSKASSEGSETGR